jgi:hypothetical protein
MTNSTHDNKRENRIGLLSPPKRPHMNIAKERAAAPIATENNRASKGFSKLRSHLVRIEFPKLAKRKTNATNMIMVEMLWTIRSMPERDDC